MQTLSVSKTPFQKFCSTTACFAQTCQIISRHRCSVDVQMAFLMAASSSLEAAKQGDDPRKLPNDSINLAGEMLKHCKKTAQALTDRCQSFGAPPSSTEDKSQMYMLIMVRASRSASIILSCAKT